VVERRLRGTGFAPERFTGGAVRRRGETMLSTLVKILKHWWDGGYIWG
jgi:hypothetical protein